MPGRSPAYGARRYSDELDFRMTDSSLRDGSHAKRHRFTTEHVRNIVATLDAARMPVIEVTHSDGLGVGPMNRSLGTCGALRGAGSVAGRRIQADRGGHGEVQRLRAAVDGDADDLVGERAVLGRQSPRLVAEQPGVRPSEVGLVDGAVPGTVRCEALVTV